MPPIPNKHLHYGGSSSKHKRILGCKPAQGVSFRSQKRFETIVRLENAAFPDTAIAAMLCISVSRLQQIKKSPEYLAARVKLTHGIILNNENELAMIKEQRREILTQQLPAAFQVLVNELNRPAITLAERKHKVTVAQDMLDREGMFAKISKAEIKPVDMFDFERADAESAAAINTIKGLAAPPSAGPTKAIEHAIEANAAFSNSHTLSAVDQQAALDKLEAEAKELDLLGVMPLPSAKIQ